MLSMLAPSRASRCFFNAASEPGVLPGLFDETAPGDRICAAVGPPVVCANAPDAANIAATVAAIIAASTRDAAPRRFETNFIKTPQCRERRQSL